MDRAYYHQYRELELNHWWFRGREIILQRLIRKHLGQQLDASKTKILNVGAATGRTSEWLREFGTVTSVEYDQECAVMAEEFTGMQMITASAEDLPFSDRSFDFVVAFDVIEHIENHALAASELLRVCKSTGLVFVTVPSFPFLWSEHDEINHHFRRYRRGELARLFAASEHQQSSYFNSWLFPLVAAVRLVKSRWQKKSQAKSSPESDFNMSVHPWLNSILTGLLSSEAFLLENGVRFPFGVSEFYIGKPDGDGAAF